MTTSRFANLILAAAIIVTSLTVSLESKAQGAKAAPAAGTASSAAKGGGGGSKRTTINFEDQLVEGQAQKPELFYLLQQRNNNFKRLIRLRENFLPEMRKSSEDVGRPPGGKGSGI